MKNNVYLCAFATLDLNLSVERFINQALELNFYKNIKVSELTKLLNIEESVKFKQTLETIYRCKLLDISFHPVNNL